jgi:hypothetical protein
VHISDRWRLDPCIGSRIFSSAGTMKGRICIVIVVAWVYRPTLGVLT